MATSKPQVKPAAKFSTSTGTVNQYFLTANTVSGAVNIRRIRYGSGTQTVTVDDPIWSQNWNPHYTIYTPFVLNGTQYFLSVNNEQGRMNIRPIKVVNGSSSVLDPVWQLP